LLIAHNTMHFAGLSEVSTTLCVFSEAHNLVFFFTNPSRWKWAPLCSMPHCTKCTVFLAANYQYSCICVTTFYFSL
jgi:hypothetical protein